MRLKMNISSLSKYHMKACVKDSLTRAIREMKVAKIEGRKLQSVDDFINEISNKTLCLYIKVRKSLLISLQRLLGESLQNIHILEKNLWICVNK